MIKKKTEMREFNAKYLLQKLNSFLSSDFIFIFWKSDCKPANMMPIEWFLRQGQSLSAAKIFENFNSSSAFSCRRFWKFTGTMAQCTPPPLATPLVPKWSRNWIYLLFPTPPFLPQPLRRIMCFTFKKKSWFTELPPARSAFTDKSGGINISGASSTVQ